MNFRLTKLKVIISVIIIIVWYIFITLYFPSHTYCKGLSCVPVDISNCPSVFLLEIIPSCIACSCPSPTPISKIFRDLLIVLIPGILVYLIWSLVQKKK